LFSANLVVEHMLDLGGSELYEKYVKAKVMPYAAA